MRARSIVRLALTLLLGFSVLASTGLTPPTISAAQAGAAQPGAAQQRPQAKPAQSASVPDEIVIQYRQDASEPDHQAAKSKAGVRGKQRVSRPGHGVMELAEVPPGRTVADAARSLNGEPAVAFAEPNYLYFAADDPNDPHYTNAALWGLSGDGTTPANAYGSQAGEAWPRGFVGDRSVHVAV